MKLTTRGRYAVTAMLDLALHAQAGPVSLSDVAVRQAISLSYLEQLFAKLKRSSLVVSSRGPGGGYLPARALHQVSVADIVDAVDERIDATRCGGHANCQDGEMCLTHQLWAELSGRIHDYLQSVSLASLVEQQKAGAPALRQRALCDAPDGPATSSEAKRLIDTLSL